MDIPVKLCCSLRWLNGVLPQTLRSSQHEPPHHSSRQALSNLLLEPYQDGMIKNDVILSLTDPSLYASAYEAFFPGDHVKSTSFEPLIHSLARKGGYVLEDDTNIVTSSMLAQDAPFREKSHLALLDVLMTQYASNHISIHKIIKTVRRLSISAFNASKELPSQVEVDSLLILWLNKVSEVVNAKLEEEFDKLVYDPDPRQRRRNKAAILGSGGKIAIPLIEGDLYRGLCDGRVLAALLLHYAPQACTWNDFNLSDQSLSQKKNILGNFQFVSNYCTSHLPAPGFHLLPEELMEWGQSGLLNTNILAFLAHLYYCFEVKGEGAAATVKKSRGLSVEPSSASSSVVRSSTRNRSRGSLHCASSGNIGKPLPGVDAAHLVGSSLQSQSAGALLAPPPNPTANSRIFGTHRQQEKNSTTSNGGSLQAELSSLNSSLSSESSRTFKAPLRTSLTSFQSKALASFGSDKYLQTRGALSQSSPLLQLHLAAPPPPPPPPSNNFISASSDTLHIEKQARPNAYIRGRGTRQQNPLEVSQRREGGHARVKQSEGLATFDNRDTVTTHQQNPLAAGHKGWQEGTDLKQSSNFPPASVDAPDGREPGSTDARVETLPVSSAIPVSTNFEGSAGPPVEQVRGSFTLDKQHTFASASAAGLPIINDKKHLAVDPSHVGPSRSAPLSERTNGEMVMLTNLLQLHQGGSTYTIASQKQPIPTDVKELRVDLRSFITSLQSESVSMAREAKMQRLKLYQPSKARSHDGNEVPGGNRLSSASVIVETTAASISELSVADSKIAGIDLKATISLPSLHHDQPPRTIVHPRRTPATSSLEQFERDEFLVQLQASPERLLQTNRGTVGHATQAMATTVAQQKASGSAQEMELPSLQQPHPLLPSTSSGQVLEQEPDSQYIAEKEAHLLPELPPNPWNKMPSVQDVDDQLMLKHKKKELLRKKSEERNRARKQRAELRKKEEGLVEQTHGQRKEKRNHDIIHQHHPFGLDDIPSSSRVALEAAETIHFQLSAHSSPPLSHTAQQQPTVLEHHAVEQPTAATAHMYRGPGCYVKPKGKSNLKIIRNAICAVCLAGEVNLTLKQKTLYELDNTTASHVMILFRDTIGFKFRGIYSYSPGERHVTRIYGTGPKEITESMISHLYKYNSGQKEFKEIPSRSLSLSMDGLTIKTEYWHSTKRKTVKAI